MKKILLLTAIFSCFAKSFACGGGDDYDVSYSVLFSQELIEDERYYPFLWAPYTIYYDKEDNKVAVKNANIASWQRELNISYPEAYYLVFKASLADIQKLLKGDKVNTEELKFATTSFVNKHKESLQYLAVAKELEPYMCITESATDGWWYYNGKNVNSSAGDIDYEAYSVELQAAYKKTKNKELKLRYGYQLIRLAHYNRKYSDAISFFDTYVKPLNLKNEMYYYALSQYAGAIRGQGDIITANSLFFQVFGNSSDLKETAFNSISLNENVNYEDFMRSAQTVDEKNDADLLLGYITFSNPLASARKIINRSPDAIQAKVLLARAMGQIENSFTTWSRDASSYQDRRLPILDKQGQSFLTETLDIVKSQTTNTLVKDKNFWNMAAAYLYYIDRNYQTAQEYLNEVDSKLPKYIEQKNILAMVIDIGKETIITDEVEVRLFSEYKDIFIDAKDCEVNRCKARGFVLSILGNRYYNQQDYTKAFMLQNVLRRLEDNPQLKMLDNIESLMNKPNKNPFENYLTQSFKIGEDVEGDEKKSTANISVLDYIAYMQGMIYLADGDLDAALAKFSKTNYSGQSLDEYVFGYNSIECFTCDDNMKLDYLDEFSYIRRNHEMGEKELTQVLLKLRKDANGEGQKAAKANYLLGNFFYNVTATGYYRNYVRFGYQGNYRQGFFKQEQANVIYNDLLTMSSIPTYYDNNINSPTLFLEQAYKLASNNELKARIVFALSKCEQEQHYQSLTDNGNENKPWSLRYNDDWVMVSKRKYFREMMKYKNTKFFDEVQSNCMYFDYYVTNVF